MGILDTIIHNKQNESFNQFHPSDVVKDVLKDFGVKSIRLITNNPDKISQVLDLGINIDDTIKLESDHFVFNEDYLKTKVDKMMHSKNLTNDKKEIHSTSTGSCVRSHVSYLSRFSLCSSIS